MRPKRRGSHNGLKLPRELQQELGIDIQPSRSRGSKYGEGSRKERRKAERREKKLNRSKRPSVVEELDDDSIGDDYELSAGSLPPSSDRGHRDGQRAKQEPHLKSILKKTTPARTPPPPDVSDGLRSSSPAFVLEKNSKTFKERAERDDAEIRALEKKLGLVGKRKLPKGFEDDGLGDLLEGLDSDSEHRERKLEGKEWLQRKKRLVEAGVSDGDGDQLLPSSSDDILEDDGSQTEDFDAIEKSEDETSGSGVYTQVLASEASDFEDCSSEEVNVPPPHKPRENPYVAPVSQRTSAERHLPPPRRNPAVTDTEVLRRLRRQIQGLLNKLSEANLTSILSEIEKLYQFNTRQDVTSTLNDLLLTLFCDRSALLATFVILHSAFIAAVYKVIGTDFGADVVSKLVERFDGYYENSQDNSGKEMVNLISLLSHLCTFKVIGTKLVFDYVQKFLRDLNEVTTELLLRIVRDVGPQLRQDDPSSLKDMVRIMQASSAKLSASGEEMSVRTKFMIESITDLKNNKIRAVNNVNGVAVEHITKLRKTLGSLSNRSLRATEPLQICRSEIKDTKKKGKWWLVGASWKGDDDARADGIQNLEDDISEALPNTLDPQETDILALARQYRMNTSVRRAIFVSIMSASDYQDAHTRLLKLRLKRAQLQEIPKVLLKCAGAESTYNPYYTLIAKKLCSDKKMKMAFQFLLWDFFKRMGEGGGLEDSDGDNGEESETVELTEIVNLAKVYGELVADGALGLTMLKAVNLAFLKEQAKMFVELFLLVILLRSQVGSESTRMENRVRAIFDRTADAPQMINDLLLFITKVLVRTDLAASQKEEETIRWGSKIAIQTLKELKSSTAAFE